MNKKNSKKGSGIVEVLFSVSIILVTLGSLIGAYIFYFQLSVSKLNSTSAIFLAEEGIEAVRLMRNDDWDGNIALLDMNTEYHLIFEDFMWNITASPQLIDETFSRTVTLEEVYRDGDGMIDDAGGGSIDENTVKVTSKVSWSGILGESEKEMSAYIPNIFMFHYEE